MAFAEEFAKMQRPADIADAALRSELVTLLAECTERQREMFGRIYPGGRDGVPAEKLSSAVDLCQRTVAKNRAGRV